VLKDNSLYYGSAEKVTELLNNIDDICTKYKKAYTEANIDVIKKEYSWEHLVDQHEQYFKELLDKAKNK
jgi:predicted SAM-dependent methyltransferase